MRDIKFRVWDELNNRMTSSNISIDFIHNMCHLFDEEFKGNPTFINSFIPLQYTGLKDKNGKEIYEGDIIKYDNEAYEVIYSNRFSSFELASTGNSVGWYELELLEIIGNIYENKELLNA